MSRKYANLFENKLFQNNFAYSQVLISYFFNIILQKNLFRKISRMHEKHKNHRKPSGQCKFVLCLDYPIFFALLTDAQNQLINSTTSCRRASSALFHSILYILRALSHGWQRNISFQLENTLCLCLSLFHRIYGRGGYRQIL